MNLGINGKVAMVCAASKGIGFASARRLVEAGCRVSICGRNEKSLTCAKEELGEQLFTYGCDLNESGASEAWYEATQKEFGDIDIFVHNNGGPPKGYVDEISLEDWEKGYKTVMESGIELANLVAPDMRKNGWGRIIYITSLAAKEPTSLLATSSVFRAGLMALVRLQASQFGPDGVTVNGVLPGHTMTDRQIKFIELIAKTEGISFEEAKKRQAAGTSLKRIGDPDEIGSAVAYLCSEPAGFITGVNLVVDGGYTKGLV